MGLVPSFSYLIIGNYRGKGMFYPEGKDEEGFFEFAKKHYPEKIKVGVFTTDYWIAKGYFYTPQDMHALPASYDMNMFNGDYGFCLATVSNAEPEVKKCVRAHRGYIASQPRSRGVSEIVEKMISRRKELKNEKSLSI